MARRARAVLDTAEVVPDLATALGRHGLGLRDHLAGPSRGARDSPRGSWGRRWRAGPAGGQVAVVFGEERRGLSDAELTLCPAVCTIPTGQAYDSMNLAQAVAVLAYEVALGRGAGSRSRPTAEPARHETVEAFWGRARTLLAGAGYLNPQNPDAILAEWRRLLARAEPTQREAELLAAAAKSLERKLGTGPAGGEGNR